MSGRCDDGAAGLAELARGLRDAGVEVSTAQVVACGEAFAKLGAEDARTCYWTGRIGLCSAPMHLPIYDAVFALWVSGADGAADRSHEPPPEVPGSVEALVPDGEAPGGPDRAPPTLTGQVASWHETLRTTRFEEATEDELRGIEAMVQELEVALPERRSRRRHAGRGGELDLAKTLERALDTDGELLELSATRRRLERRRLVLVLDISSSMAAHARALLRFAVAARRSGGPRGDDVEVFVFGTRLTRITPHLFAREPDAAIAQATEAVSDWQGGTRIGDSIDELVRVWGRRRVLRGAVVVVCSDGLERGDPEHLGASVARLSRHAHRLVWVNPLTGDPRFAPTQRGMAAALPHVDVFRPGHDLASLEGLASALSGLR